MTRPLIATSRGNPGPRAVARARPSGVARLLLVPVPCRDGPRPWASSTGKARGSSFRESPSHVGALYRPRAAFAGRRLALATASPRQALPIGALGSSARQRFLTRRVTAGGDSTSPAASSNTRRAMDQPVLVIGLIFEPFPRCRRPPAPGAAQGTSSGVDAARRDDRPRRDASTANFALDPLRLRGPPRPHRPQAAVERHQGARRRQTHRKRSGHGTAGCARQYRIATTCAAWRFNFVKGPTPETSKPVRRGAALPTVPGGGRGRRRDLRGRSGGRRSS